MIANPVSVADLTRAIEGRDAQTLIDFYADDAVVRIIDRDHPPSTPYELRGKNEIAAYFRDVCGRAMTHRIESAVADGDRLAFVQACVYPEGSRVACSAMLELRDGRIARQTCVQAWDS